MYLSDQGKYKLEWVFEAGKYRGSNEYKYNKIIFTISENGKDLICEFCAKRKNDNVVFRLKNFRNKTALQAKGSNRKWGRHFEEGILQVYHDLGLPLGFVEPTMKEVDFWWTK